MSSLAHDPDKTVRACTMGEITTTPQCNKTMNKTEAVRIFTPRNGVCYIHNFERFNSSNDPESVASPGPDYGLHLIFDIQSHYYMRYGLTPTTGISLTFNNPRTLPLILAKPIFIGR